MEGGAQEGGGGGGVGGEEGKEAVLPVPRVHVGFVVDRVALGLFLHAVLLL